MSEEQLKKLTEIIRSLLMITDSTQRLEVLRNLDICLNCGADTVNGICYCTNDE